MPSFDPHDHRARMKLLESGRDNTVYENRDGVRCPVCDRVFDRVLATEERSHQFTPGTHVEFCVFRENGELFVFTHQPA